MLIRILLFAGLAWLAWNFFRQWQARNALQERRGSEPTFEPTVRCNRCGAYLPASSLSRSGLCGRCSD